MNKEPFDQFYIEMFGPLIGMGMYEAEESVMQLGMTRNQPESPTSKQNTFFTGNGVLRGLIVVLKWKWEKWLPVASVTVSHESFGTIVIDKPLLHGKTDDGPKIGKSIQERGKPTKE